MAGTLITPFVAIEERDHEQRYPQLMPANPTNDWIAVGIVFDGDAIYIAGANPWLKSWLSTGEVAQVRHPAYPRCVGTAGPGSVTTAAARARYTVLSRCHTLATMRQPSGPSTNDSWSTKMLSSTRRRTRTIAAVSLSQSTTMISSSRS